jgi:uncharacterized membrane protein
LHDLSCGQSDARKLPRSAKKIVLESVADLKKHAAVVYAQTVQGRAMPLGNQTDMTEGERAALGQWLKEAAP